MGPLEWVFVIWMAIGLALSISACLVALMERWRRRRAQVRTRAELPLYMIIPVVLFGMIAGPFAIFFLTGALKMYGYAGQQIRLSRQKVTT